jgi:hypothetical protein
MRDVCSLIWLALIGLFRSRASLEAEILTLRHQLNVLRRKSPPRLTFTSIDRLVFAGLYRLAPGVLDASYAGFWVTRRSGGVVCRRFEDLDAVFESDTRDNLRQVICAFQPPPGFRCGDDQLEHHQLGGC